jgi:hypothetical protein
MTIDSTTAAIPGFAACYGTDRHLVDSIADIKRTVGEIWSGERLLEGFTDHGPDHSERVTRRVDEILGATASRLSKDEGYVLHAACWLHDIAMQDYCVLLEFDGQRPDAEPLSSEERRVVRESHAARGKDLLVDPALRRVRVKGRGQPVELPVPPGYWLHVGEIAGAHSTAGFIGAQQIEDDNGPTGSAPFRYRLLAGVLMMADELDLDYSRARALDQVPLDNVDSESLLHLLKHRYVQRVHVGAPSSDPSARYVELAFNWPRNQDRQARAYEIWIRHKLMSQMRMVDPLLQRDLGIHWDLDCAIRIRLQRTFQVVSIPQRVVPLLERERARVQLADLREQLDELERRFCEGKVILLVEPSGQGQDGASEIAEFLVGSFVTSLPETVRRLVTTSWLDPLQEAVYESGSGPVEFVEFIRGAAAAETADDLVSAAEPTAGDIATADRMTMADMGVPEGEEAGEHWVGHGELLARLLETSQVGGTRVLVVKNADRLPRPTRELLSDALRGSLGRAEGPVRVILTAEDPEELFEDRLPASVHRCELPRVPRPDLREFLKGYSLLPVGQLEAFVDVVVEHDREITQTVASGVAARLVASCIEV